MDFHSTTRKTNPGVPDLDEGSAEARVPTLTLLRGGLPGRMYRVQRAELRIGRHPDCEIQLDDGGVSRVHACIRVASGDTIEILDHGSTNGTFVNGRRVDGARLRDGDKVQLGSMVVFRFNFQDAIDEAFQREQFESMTRDALTGCHNRLYFDEALRRELAYARRTDADLVVGLLDLDHFKDVNDTHGHAVGDQVLRVVAETLYDTLRPYDVLSRYGGEEFAVLLRGTDLVAARSVCERLRTTLEHAVVPVDGEYVVATASFGLASARECPGEDGPAIVRLADQRLYSAKLGGRNHIAWGQDAARQPAETTVPLEVDEVDSARAEIRRRREREAAQAPTDPSPAQDIGAGDAAAAAPTADRSRKLAPAAMTLMDGEMPEEAIAVIREALEREARDEPR
jgi:two-component system cell cycle response regulator